MPPIKAKIFIFSKMVSKPNILYFSFDYFLFILIISLTNGVFTTNPNIRHSFLNKLNISTASQQKWLLKSAIPSHFRDFMELYLTNKTAVELLQSDWLDGVSPDCKFQTVDWLARLNQEHWNDIITEDYKWVLQMIDAWGKLPEGIMSGHVKSYGDYDQCVQTVAVVNETVIPGEKISYSFSGMYCNMFLVPLDPEMMTSLNMKFEEGKLAKEIVANTHNGIQEAVSLEELIKIMFGAQSLLLSTVPTLGTCFPNTCTQNDIFTIFMNLMNDFYSQLPIESPSLYLVPVSCTDRHKPSVDTATICVIILLAVLVGLALCAGTLDYWQRHYKPKSSITKLQSYRYLMAFSIYTNTKKLLGTHRSSEDLSCLHGIRFLSTAWVVLGHTYVTFLFGPQWNLVDIQRAQNKWPEMAIFNGTFSVDTFFLMSGMLATYNIFKMLDKNKGKINILMLYIHRYIRLTPCYAILVGIVATLYKYTLHGPQEFAMLINQDNCRKYWWTNVLYINNLVKTDQMCNPESWYLANDMQFFILSPFIVYPIWRWKTIGTVMLSVYTILSCIAPVLVTRFVPDALPAAALTRPEAFGPGFVEIYQRPWSRISTFLVGVWLGWILHKTKNRKVNIKRPTVILLWFASAAITLSVIFGISPWFDPVTEIPKVAGYFYAGLSRFTFAVGVAWVIFACLKGYGGIVNEFLSWRAFMPLGRLCFCVYLTSYHVQEIFHSRLTVPIKWESYTLINIYFAHMVMSYFVGFLCTLLFESPFIIVQKLMFERADVSPKDKQSNGVTTETVNENNNHNLGGVKVSTE